MNDVVDVAQETTINNQYVCLQSSENVIKSIQKKLIQFKQSTDNMHASQKSLHEDLIALQDKFLDRDSKSEINAFFDGFSQTLINIQQSLVSLPSKINEFIQNIDALTKNQWKKRQFLKEKYEHYLNKVKDLVIKQEEQAAKQNPNNFILSAGSGVGTIAMQNKRNNPKFTRNNDKLKNSTHKYQDINNRVAQELGNLIKMRNSIATTISKQLTDTLVDNVLLIQANTESIRKKNDTIIINQNSNRSNNGIGSNAPNSLSKMKFCSTNSVEQEQLEREITIRGIFKIPASMDLPVIRRRSIKITQDGQVKSDHDSHGKKEYDPVPFESNNPNIIIYLSRLVQQDKNIFDFEDFNNKEAIQEEDNSKHSNNNQVQDHSGFEGSIERVYTQEDSQLDEENEDENESEKEDDSDNLEICDDDDDELEEEEGQQNKSQEFNAKKSSQKSSPETAPRKMSGAIGERQKKETQKSMSNNNIIHTQTKKNQQNIKKKKGKSKKTQQKILSDSIFKYEQERKKQLISQILIKEGGGIPISTQNNITNHISNNNQFLNPQSSNTNNLFNNFYQNQSFNNSASQQKQQISPQGSIPEKSNRSNVSQGSNNQNNQISMNSLQDQQPPQRLSQNRQNAGLNPNHFYSATNQVNNINLKIPTHNPSNNNNNQQQTLSSPKNFLPPQPQNSNLFNGNNPTNSQVNNLFLMKQAPSSGQQQSNIQFSQQQSNQFQHQNDILQINQQRSNSNLNNLPSPKYFNNLNNNNSNNFSNNNFSNNINSQSYSNQVSTPQNTNTNQSGPNQGKSQFSQQSFQSPAQTSQPSFNYFTPPPPVYQSNQQQGSNNQQQQQHHQYYQQGNQQLQQQQQPQNSRSSLPSNLNSSNQNYNQHPSNQGFNQLSQKPPQNNINDAQFIQRNSHQPSQQQSFQNSNNVNKNQLQNVNTGISGASQGNVSYARKNSDGIAMNQQDNFGKSNNKGSHSQFNSDDKNPQQNFNANIAIQKQQHQKELTFNTQYEKVVNGQLNYNNQQQQKPIYQGNNMMNGQMQQNTFVNGQMHPNQVMGPNKLQKISSMYQEEQKMQQGIMGSQTTTNQQTNQIRNFYQQQGSVANMQVPQHKIVNPEMNDMQKRPYNLNPKGKQNKLPNLDIESDQDNSVLSLTLIED